MTILYFAWVRQKLGRSEEIVQLSPTVNTVRELALQLRERGGVYAEAFSDLDRIQVAVNREHCGWDAPVTDDGEVAFFPPVTGG